MCATHSLIKVNICFLKLFEIPPIHYQVITQTRVLCVKNKGPTALEKMMIELWFMYTTHSLIEVNICAKLFENPPIHDQVIARTRV